MICFIGAEIWFLSYVEMGLLVILCACVAFICFCGLLVNLALVKVSFRFLVLLYAISMFPRSPGSFSLCFSFMWCSLWANLGLDGW